MPTTALGEEIQSLGSTLQLLLGESSLGIQCTLRNGRLIVLGQHTPETTIDPTQTLRSLERTIQSLHLQVSRQVQLYLRILGEQQPYAGRRFAIQPPPPPPNPRFCQPPPAPSLPSAAPADVTPTSEPQTVPEERWLVADEELDSLLNELVPSPSVSEQPLATTTIGAIAPIPGHGPDQPTAETSTAAQFSIIPYVTEADPSPPPPAAPVGLDRRVTIATGVAFGLAGGLYVLTRPCMIGVCSELQTAQGLNQESMTTIQQAETLDELKLAQTDLNQAIALLDRVPLWSPQGQQAHRLLSLYQEQAIALEDLVAIEDMAATAEQRSQTPPLPLEEWQAIIALWESAIQQLRALSPDSEFYSIAQQRLPSYEAQLRETRTQLAMEQRSQDLLAIAQQTAELAEARQKIAQSLANWQMTRATWQVVMMRLTEIPPGTQTAIEAEPLIKLYQARLKTAEAQVEQEKATNHGLEQAATQAQKAQAAEQRYDWSQAVEEWDGAIAIMETLPDGTSQQARVESLENAYQAYRDRAQQKLEAADRIASELAQSCVGELQICRLLSVDETIRVQLEQRYVGAIETARNSGDNNLQAVVADHQLRLRRGLEAIANQFQLPVEVFDPASMLLDRHMPR